MNAAAEVRHRRAAADVSAPKLPTRSLLILVEQQLGENKDTKVSYSRNCNFISQRRPTVSSKIIVVHQNSFIILNPTVLNWFNNWLD